jgi:hypothetical protein
MHIRARALSLTNTHMHKQEDSDDSLEENENHKFRRAAGHKDRSRPDKALASDSRSTSDGKEEDTSDGEEEDTSGDSEGQGGELEADDECTTEMPVVERPAFQSAAVCVPVSEPGVTSGVASE